MNSKQTMTLMEKAKSRLLFRHIFFASLILSTNFIETRRYPRAATNMKDVFWNPDFINSLKIEVIMFVLCHEMFHIILKHGLRIGGRDPELWNIACDHYINLKLQEYQFEVWDRALCDPKYKGMYEEQIYASLLTECSVNQEGDEQGDGEGEKTQGGDAGSPGGEGEEDGGESAGDQQQTISKTSKRGNHKKDGVGDDLVYDDLSNDPVERAKLERRIDGIVARAASQAQLAGTMPAGLELLVQGIINPPQPWFALFADHMRKIAHDEETWSRRNRRIHDFVLPTQHNPGMGPIGVIGDTSGSMLSYNVFPQIGEEMTYMMSAARPEFIQVIWADHAEASSEQRFYPGEIVTLKPRGGGGTDMRLPLRKMEEYEVDVCVLVTDAETLWPDAPTPFPLIILTTTGQATPSWAMTIRIR